MAESIHIRSFCHEDEKSICALWAETWHATYDAVSGHSKVEEGIETARTQTIASIYLGNPAHRMLVAEVGNQIGGTITCRENSTCCVICELFVRPPLQRRGIGTLLLSSLLNSLREYDQVSLMVLALHSHVVDFYQRHGFIVGKRVVQPLYGMNQEMVEMRLAGPGKRPAP